VKNWVDRIAVFDTETTGLAVNNARIVTSFVGVLDSNGALEESHQWIADPGIEIPLAASNIHGITTEHAREFGAEATKVVGEIRDLINSYFAENLPIVAFNASYDFSVLHHESIRHGLEPIVDVRPVIDPLVIDRAVDKYRKGKRTLETTANHYKVTLENSHQADSDAVAAGLIAQTIIRSQNDEVFSDPLLLHEQQVSWSKEWSASYQNFRRSRGELDFTADGQWPVRI